MPSIGKDLVTIRTHLGLTIQDIQNATKIPLQTLESIEDNSIFDHSVEIQTYVRSFVRSYGRAIKLDDDLVVSALDLEEIGSYKNQLLTAYPELAKDQPDESIKDEEPVNTDEKTEPETEPVKSEEKKSSRFEPDFDDEPAATPSAARKSKPYASGTAPDPYVRKVNWADVGKKMSDTSPKPPVWVIGGAVILVVVIASVWFLSQSEIFSSDDTSSSGMPVPEETTPPGSPDGSELNLDLADEVPDGETTAPAELDEILYLTVFAANNNLDPVRVWSDLKPRMDPYWMDQGLAYNFEFRDTIRVRGQYNQMLLFFNGHNIENFRQNHYNSDENAVELTRELFEEDPRWTNTIPFELPPDVTEPDSVANRPSF